MLLLDDYCETCPYCGWVMREPHTDTFHASLYRWWLERLARAMRRLDGQSR